MSLEELEVRGWRDEWKDWKSRPDQYDQVELIAAKGRSGVHDFNFSQYNSIAYEAVDKETGQVVARAEGRDALNRLGQVLYNMEKLNEFK